MRPNPVKQKLLAGGIALGTFVFEFDTTGIVRIAGHAGAEFVIIDMEHTGWSVETVRRLIATIPPDGPVPIVRVPATEYHFIARVLDVGAMGLMFPMVGSVEQAKHIVHFAKYPPRGGRGAAFGISHDGYAGGDIAEKMRSADEHTLIITQIETRSGLECCEDIAAVDGVDCLWIGQFDLSNSLGIPGQFTHPVFTQAMDRVMAACDAHAKIPGFMATTIAEAKSLLDRGFRAISYGADLWIYQQALRDALKELRGHTK